MTDETRETISQTDVTAFGYKLAGWANELSAKERAILTDLVTRAAASDPDDVQGYDNFNRDGPFTFFVFPGLIGSGGSGDSSGRDRDRRTNPPL